MTDKAKTSWEPVRDECLYLSDQYVKMIEKSLRGEPVDMLSEIEDLLFWEFGLNPLHGDDSIFSFYEQNGIPKESRWRGSGGLKAFEEWKGEWEARRKSVIPDGDIAEDMLAHVEKMTLNMICDQKPRGAFHYRTLAGYRVVDVSPVTLNSCCQKLERDGKVEEIAPGIWSDLTVWGVEPATLSEIKSKITNEVLPGWKTAKSLYDRLRSRRIYKSYVEMERDARKVFEYLGFHSERRGKPGETDVVAWDDKNIVIMECKAYEKFPLRELRTKIGGHAKKILEEPMFSRKKAIYAILSHNFTPFPDSKRMLERHNEYIVQAEKQVEMLVVPICFNAFYSLIPLAQERRYLPGDIISLLTKIRKRYKRGIWWSDIDAERKKWGRRLSLSILLDDLYKILSENSGKMKPEEIVDDLLSSYKYRDLLGEKEIGEARADLERLLDILDHLEITLIDGKTDVVLRVPNLPFIKRRLEEWFFGEPWNDRLARSGLTERLV